MKITTIEPFRCKLGEGPLWDVREQALYGTDLLNRSIWRYDPATGERDEWVFADQTGSFALREGGGAIVALTSGLYLCDFTSRTQHPIVDPCAWDEQLQLNDGKVDRAGRFVVGSVHQSGAAATAGFYSVGRDLAVATLDSGFVVTNGPCWSPAGDILYVADTATGDIVAYDYDTATGAASGRRLFANTAALGGGPDGATVDAAGFLWSAICGGSKVVRYAPDGAVALVIDMPTPLISSVMFGGPDLDRLFVTSIDGAAAALDIEMAARNPVPHDEYSGALFVIDGLGVTGIPEPRFAG